MSVIPAGGECPSLAAVVATCGFGPSPRMKPARSSRGGAEGLGVFGQGRRSAERYSDGEASATSASMRRASASAQAHGVSEALSVSGLASSVCVVSIR